MKKVKTLKSIWIRSLRVIGILWSSSLSKQINLNLRLIGNKSLGSIFKPLGLFFIRMNQKK